MNAASPLRHIVVAAAALNQTPMDWEGNAAQISEAIARAKAQQAQLLCLPELCISGYGCEDAFHSEALSDWALQSLLRLLPLTTDLAVVVGLPVRFENRLYNCAAVLVDQRLQGCYAKQVLAGTGVYYEPRWFTPWPPGVTRMLEVDGQAVPIGDVRFRIGGLRLGIEICEDAWQPQATLPSNRFDVLCHPSASHFAMGKYAVSARLVLERSRQAQCSYLYANLLGNDAGPLIFDGSAIVASNGSCIAEQRRFSFQRVQLLCATINPSLTRLEQRRTQAPQPVLTDAEPAPQLVEIPFQWRAAAAPAEFSAQHLARTDEPDSAYLEFLHATALGLWDYLRKSHSKGYTISLSGGIDSSALTVLCGAMVRMAAHELGLRGVSAALPQLDLPAGDASDTELEREASPKQSERELSAKQLEQKQIEQCKMLSAALIHTAYQSGVHSSAHTAQAAQAIAAAVGTTHQQWPIDTLVAAYEQLSAVIAKRPLSWQTDDLTRQNVQARVRATAIWMLANLKQQILLVTSNRSEAAVGYVTMDGDSSGGLAPLAGVSKSFLKAWLQWFSGQDALPAGHPTTLPAALHGFDVHTALQQVLAMPPTAELRPAAAQQSDETDLMPYPLLDAIEQAAIRDKMSPRQVWQALLPTEAAAGLTPQELAAQVKRFFELWSQSQWKRERFALCFHVDDQNLDPRTWCRFPVLSGAWRSELDELAAHAAAPATPAD